MSSPKGPHNPKNPVGGHTTRKDVEELRKATHPDKPITWTETGSDKTRKELDEAKIKNTDTAKGKRPGTPKPGAGGRKTPSA